MARWLIVLGLALALAQAGDAAGWVAVRAPRLTVFAQGSSEVAYAMALEGEAALDELQARLEVTLGQRARLRCYTDVRAFYEAVGVTRQTTKVLLGLAERDEPVVYLLAPYGAFPSKQTLRHELTHLLVFASVKPHEDALPLWVNEGLAVHLSGVMAHDLGAPPEAMLQPGNLLPLESIETSFPPSQPALTLAYEQSRSLIAYWEKRHGFESIRQALALVAAGRSFPEAFREASGEELPDFFEQWSHRVAPVALLKLLPELIISLLFFGAALAIVVSYVRRRKALASLPDDEEESAEEDPEDGEDEEEEELPSRPVPWMR